MGYVISSCGGEPGWPLVHDVVIAKLWCNTTYLWCCHIVVGQTISCTNYLIEHIWIVHDTLMHVWSLWPAGWFLSWSQQPQQLLVQSPCGRPETTVSIASEYWWGDFMGRFIMNALWPNCLFIMSPCMGRSKKPHVTAVVGVQVFLGVASLDWYSPQGGQFKHWYSLTSLCKTTPKEGYYITYLFPRQHNCRREIWVTFFVWVWVCMWGGFAQFPANHYITCSCIN